MSGAISGLNRTQRIHARDLAVEAALLSIKHADKIHYTQGPRRWDGINKGLRASKGQYPTYGDCSSMATWWLWQGLHHYGVRDTVNGENWKAGYTGTILTHGKVVKKQKNWQRGDLLVYGTPGGTGKHVTMYLGSGKVASHGSEAGPFKLDWNYRSDLIGVRRAI